MRKLTREEFIEKANKVHNYKYDYSKVNYVNSKTKVIIICPIHGEFLQLANAHLSGQKCPKCALHEKNNTKFSWSELIEKFNNIHNYKYQYFNFEYKSQHEKINIKCPIHGFFKQRTIDHLNGYGCPYCNGEISWKYRIVCYKC